MESTMCEGRLGARRAEGRCLADSSIYAQSDSLALHLRDWQKGLNFLKPQALARIYQRSTLSSSTVSCTDDRDPREPLIAP